MSLPVVALVLGAALLHATWNALLKSGDDRFRSIVLMTGAASLTSLPALLFLPVPRAAAWPAIALSAALHVGYNLFLVRSYRHGDLGQIYPLARGSSPLLVLAGAMAVAGERPDAGALAGIVTISAGIVSLARGRDATSPTGLFASLVTGAFIAAYTVTDGLGGRLSGNPVAYALWLFVLDGIPMTAIYLIARRGPARRLSWDREAAKAAAGGIVSLLAYTAVIWAASVSPMGPVSAMRETSVVFAALMGWAFLGEPLTKRRLMSAVLVALGAVVLTLRS